MWGPPIKAESAAALWKERWDPRLGQKWDPPPPVQCLHLPCGVWLSCRRQQPVFDTSLYAPQPCLPLWGWRWASSHGPWKQLSTEYMQRKFRLLGHLIYNIHDKIVEKVLVLWSYKFGKCDYWIPLAHWPITSSEKSCLILLIVAAPIFSSQRLYFYVTPISPLLNLGFLACPWVEWWWSSGSSVII